MALAGARTAALLDVVAMVGATEEVDGAADEVGAGDVIAAADGAALGFGVSASAPDDDATVVAMVLTSNLPTFVGAWLHLFTLYTTTGTKKIAAATA